ncbi:hypothetical protein PG991_010710 [Apiospora marii]|uniref:Nephrocystin 3-like N-terminal domain-containing protein n=1 Tax=Apiospora marii TaxID=335849 RepID=A0ABR1RC53_9PEZI
MLARHIGYHLRHLSFFSLSYIDLDYDEDTSEGAGSGNAENGHDGGVATSTSRDDKLSDIPETAVDQDGARHISHITELRSGSVPQAATRTGFKENFEDEPPPLEEAENWEFILDFQVEGARESTERSLQFEERQFDEQTLQQTKDVYNWLRPTNVGLDQASLVEARAEYPGTGQWLLENKLFKEWFDPRFPTIPPLLWIIGIPGAGKTMLASLVVQKARELEPAPTVLYFYCRYDDPERDNFVSLGRSLLAQLLHHDNALTSSSMVWTSARAKNGKSS